MFLEELLLFLFTFFFNYKVKGENGLNHNNSNHYIDGDQLGALHWHGRVTELNHMWGWLPGWCDSSLDMQKTSGLSWGKFHIELEGQRFSKRRGPEVQRSPFPGKTWGTESFRWWDWVESQAHLVLCLEMGLCLRTLGSHQIIVRIKSTCWKDSSGWVIDNRLERCKPESQSELWQKSKHETVGSYWRCEGWEDLSESRSIKTVNWSEFFDLQKEAGNRRHG